MADARLRAAEVAAEEGGLAQRARLLRERVRAGLASEASLGLAAFLGDPAARLADPPARGWRLDLLTDEDLGGLAALRSLTRLRLRFSPALTGEGLGHLRALSGLQELGITDFAQFADDDLARVVEPLRALERLDLGFVATGDATLRALAKLERLERLDCTRGVCTGAGVAWLQEHPSLRRWDLSRCSGLVSEDLGSLPAGLEWLSLNGCFALSGAGLTQLVRLRRLASLDVRRLYEIEGGLEALSDLPELAHVALDPPVLEQEAARAALSRWPAFEALTLGHWQLRFQRALAALPRLEGLRRLHVTGGPVLLDGDLSALSDCGGLRSLRVEHCPSAGAATAAAVGRLVALEELSLAHCRGVGDPEVAAWPALPALRTLDLRGCEAVRGEGLWPLERWPRLEVLDLSGTQVGLETLTELLVSPQLSVVRVHGCRGVSGSALRALREAHPHVSVEGRSRGRNES